MKPIASYHRTKEILAKYQRFAKSSFGQNFIIDPSVVDKIAELSKAEKNSSALEIGPGIGALSEFLAKRASQVTCVEIDPDMVEILKDTCADYKNMKVIQADFLTFDLESWVKEQRLTHERVIVCANLPYYITTPILFRLFESKEPVDVITVMMQKEVAMRFVANTRTKDYNALSVIVQYLYETKIVLHVGKHVFLPKPNVDSAVVQFIPKKIDRTLDQDKFFDLVKACFKQRRKTISNNLSEYIEDKPRVASVLEQSGIRENQRAEELDIENFIKLYEVMYENKGIR